jgi:two-component system, OmpR family, response regulator
LIQSDGVDVVVLRWPEEIVSVERLRAVGTPRLLLVAPASPPPEHDDCDEEWIRLPADDADLRVRLATVAARATRHAAGPVAKDDGRLVFRGRWIALSAIRNSLARALVERFGEVVPAEELMAGAWPDGDPSDTALRVHLSRLRREIAPLGLHLGTVPSRGYVLESGDAVEDRLASS